MSKESNAMRSEAIAILLSLGFAATPAWAGQAGDNSESFGHQSLRDAPTLAPDNDQAGGPEEFTGLQSADALKQSLQKAGFSDLQIAAGSYIVHAKGPDGKPVVLVITPDSVAVAKEQNAEVPDLDQNGDEGDGGAQDQDMPQPQQND
jgi:hypothetical protein